MAAWELIVEAVEYARRLGKVPSFSVSDTAPTVRAHTTALGVRIPDGWSSRPGWDFHKEYKAVDFGGFRQSSLARFFMGYQSRLDELIHYVSAGEQYGVKFGSNWGYAYAGGHDNHLHVAINEANARYIRDQLKAEYDAEQARINANIMRKMLITLKDGDGAVWISDGITRAPVADHSKVDRIEGNQRVIEDSRFVNAQVLTGLINNRVTPVDNLDAFGAEVVPSQLDDLLDKADEILGWLE